MTITAVPLDLIQDIDCFVQRLERVLPHGFQVDLDNDRQLIVYTNLKLMNDGLLMPITSDDPLVNLFAKDIAWCKETNS